MTQPSKEHSKRPASIWARFAISSWPVLLLTAIVPFIWGGANLVWALGAGVVIISAIECAIRFKVSWDADEADAPAEEESQVSSLAQ